MIENPILPYDGTSGWAGSPASHSRAISEDTSGTTLDRQQLTLEAVRKMGIYGMTWRELALKTDLHHGQASGSLSVLHRSGELVRLTNTRDRCSIYVTPDCVAGRATTPHRSVRNRAERDTIERIKSLVNDYPAMGYVAVVEIIKILEEHNA